MQFLKEPPWENKEEKNHFYSSVIPKAKLREQKNGIFEFGGWDDILAKFAGCS
jgi:hypothetical protein